MAGNFPDAPAHRLAWDRDGTTAYIINVPTTTIVSELTEGQMRTLNSEDAAYVGVAGSDSNRWLLLIFPEPRSIAAYSANFDVGSSGTRREVEWSPNTTNGVDGEWHSLGNYVQSNGTTVGMRSPAAVSIANAIGMRWRNTSSGGGAVRHIRVRTIHLYGAPVAGDRLALWHPSLDQEVGPAHLDWGDAPRATSADKTFRVKNLSPTLTAQAPLVEVEALTDTTPSVAGQHLLSTDGVIFGATRTLPDLAPGEISGQITLRRNLASDATTTLWWPRLVAVAATWTT